MKRFLFAAAALAAIVLPSTTQAQCFDPCDFMTGYYASLKTGANFNHLSYDGSRCKVSTDTGYVVSGSVGVKMVYDVRLEGEIGYRRNSIDKIKVNYPKFKHEQKLNGHVSSLSFMANAIYDIPVCYFVRPYVGFGVGYAKNYVGTHLKHKKETYKAHHSKNGFAWQGIAGLAYPIECFSCYGVDQLDATLEYRYFKPNIRHCYDQSVAIGLVKAL